MQVIITGRVADSAGTLENGRIEFAQAQRIDTGELLVTSNIAVAQVVEGELRTRTGEQLRLPVNPEGSAVRVREILGGQTFEWWTAVPNAESIEYRELPILESTSVPESVWGPPPWTVQVQQMRDETLEAIQEGAEVAEALGGLSGLQGLLTQADEAATRAGASADSATASADRAMAEADRAEAAANSIDMTVINERLDVIDETLDGKSSKEYVDKAVALAGPQPLSPARKAQSVWSGIARPAPGIWPSGFKIDPDNPGDIYIFHEEPSAVRIGLYRLSGGPAITERRVLSPSSVSSTENTIMWRDQNGDVKFVVRATSGSFYHVYNFTKDVLGPAVAIDGAFKIASHGDLVFTCDARTIRGGVGRIYEYTLESVKAGAPVKVRELDLENRNMYSKTQGMSATADRIVFSLGRSNHLPGMSAYTRSGRHIETFEFDKKAFGAMLKQGVPELVLNESDYKHETEGSDVVAGVVYSGHAVYSGADASAAKFVIVRHGEGEEVPVNHVANPSAAAALPEDLVLVPALLKTGGATVPSITRTGDMVTVAFEAEATAALTGANRVGSLPNGFRPLSTYRDSGRATAADFNISFWPNGDIRIDNIKPASPGIPSGAWVPVSATFRGGNGMDQ